jgi:hypothetical protein
MKFDPLSTSKGAHTAEERYTNQSDFGPEQRPSALKETYSEEDA